MALLSSYITIPFLFCTPGDTSLGEVVNRYLNSNLIAGQNPYIVHSQFSRDPGSYYVSVRELYLEVCVRQSFKHYALELNYIVFRQNNPSLIIHDTYALRSGSALSFLIILAAVLSVSALSPQSYDSSTVSRCLSFLRFGLSRVLSIPSAISR